MTDFRARLRRGDTLIGPLVSLGAAEVSELFALAGFDWVWLDLEHAHFADQPQSPKLRLKRMRPIWYRCPVRTPMPT